MKLRERFNKINILSALAVSTACGFTACFFSPLEIYFGNPSDYQLTAAEAVLPMLAVAGVVSLGMFLIFLLLLLIHENLFRVCKCLAFGGLLGCYVQMMFLNGKMSLFTGDAIVYSGTDPFMIADFLIFYFLLFTPVILFAATKIKDPPKFSKHLSPKIIPVLCLILLVMQTAGFVPGLMRTNEALKGREVRSQKYFSYAPTLSLSQDENIVVFLTDRLDGHWMQEMLDTYPDVNNMLDGFTFYQNNISRNTNTFPAVPEMLSGQEYHGETWSKFVDRLWNENLVLKPLHENGWQVNLIIDSGASYSSLNRVQEAGFADNLIETNCLSHVNYLGSGSVTKTMLKFSAVKMMPYFLKDCLSTKVTIDPQFSENYVILDEKQNTEDLFSGRVSVKSDLKFYNYMQEHEMDADSNKKVFNFIHLACTHIISEQIAALAPDYDPEADLVISTARGEFEMMHDYFEEMKRLGIYDSTTIIILGDHARAPEGDEVVTGKLESELLTALLIKPRDAGSEPLQFDTVSQLSNVNFPASILEYAGIEHADLGLSYNDIIAEQPDLERRLNVYDFMGEFAAPVYRGSYCVREDARDFSNWEFLGTDRGPDAETKG